MGFPTGTSVVFSGFLPDCQLAWSTLRGHGIEAWLLNQDAGTWDLPRDVEVRVRTEDVDAARELLASPSRERA